MVNTLEIENPNLTATSERIITGLKRLRDEYKDEMPEEIVHSYSPGSKTKARKGWFCSVSGLLESLNYLGLIEDPITSKRLERGIEKFNSERFKNRERTRKIDITYGNLLINLALGEV
ncbi:hypothetical protein A2867_04680 [Candidatus Daviesbacteria bacterium RIFCSPHIGHO2_01_FULL_40_11]|uniref:Uncharacterized protein n=1 Tax=Candidatus Daviesbacteria bacterium RIFCSPHIGHO2_01_FULL_40_11 TaxID=1797762 RepID=A0A1F5JJB7_9BACT|nr:MAG: hypothetical protein A2867_04680 [Candidatus Daviesbacteria bacterium RIFCSPHIGHO2_01_FULL_40_11]OGE62751.1 MAG: hypothetical protein A2964_00515 [Candidatus Daviesbacteria bacterium RIFCSPLOWO2_01_FULL_40_27]